MLYKLGATMLACLAMVGTAHADQSDGTGDAEGAPVPAPVTTAPIHVQIDRDIAAPLGVKEEAIQIGGLDLTLPPPGAAGGLVSIAVEEDIALCSSMTCRKRMQFVLSCKDADGKAVEARSPWYRNYVTRGKETKIYSFEALPLAQCATPPTVDFDVQLGWLGTMPLP